MVKFERVYHNIEDADVSDFGKYASRKGKRKDIVKKILDEGLVPQEEYGSIFVSSRPEIYDFDEDGVVCKRKPNIIIDGSNIEFDRDDTISAHNIDCIYDFVKSKLKSSGKALTDKDIKYLKDAEKAKYDYEKLHKLLMSSVKKDRNKYDSIPEPERDIIWNRMENLTDEYLGSLNDEEWDRAVGFYKTDKSIDPSNIKIYTEGYVDEPINLVSIKHGYPDYTYVPIKYIGSDEFVNDLVNEVGSLDEANNEVTRAIKESENRYNDHRLMSLRKSIREKMKG